MNRIITILTIFHSSLAWAQAPMPSPSFSAVPAANIKKVCAEAKKTAGNPDNPSYAPSEIAIKCTEIEMSKVAADTSKRLRNMKIPIVATCGVAAGLCYAGVTAAAGQVAAIACSALGVGSQVYEGMATDRMAEKMGQESAGLNIEGAAGSSVAAGKEIQEITKSFKAAKDAGGKVAKGTCATIGISTLLESAAMTKHGMDYSDKSNKWSEAKRKLGAFAAGGAGEVKFDKSDQDYKYDESDDSMNDWSDDVAPLADFPPEAIQQFEELSGMKMEDVANYNGDPNALVEELMKKMGAPEAAVAQIMEQLNKSGPLSTDPMAEDGTQVASGYGSGSEYGSNGLMKGGKSGLSETDFKPRGRDLANYTPKDYETDKAHNIFQRVTIRYGKKVPHLEKLSWSNKFNRKLASTLTLPSRNGSKNIVP